MFLVRWFLYITNFLPAWLFFNIKKIYLQKRKEKFRGPVIIAMNHTSFCDYVEALLAFPFRRIYVLISHQMYSFNPVLTFLLKAMGVIKVADVTGNMDAIPYSFIPKAISRLKESF